MESFISQLTRSQSSLYGYILSLLPDRQAAEDVLQETNLTLWRKSDEFREGSDFLAWACTVAHYKVLAARRQHARDRHLFDDDLLDRLQQKLSRRTETWDQRRDRLRRCLAKLPENQRQLLEERYAGTGSVQDMAQAAGRSTAVISQTLYRIRLALLECINRGLARQKA